MDERDEIINALKELVADVLREYDARVTDSGHFADLRFKRQVYFGDPEVALPGLLELAVMNMDDQLNPDNKTMRFAAVRVKKSARGGTVSSTCFHGTKTEVKAALELERTAPSALLARVEELSSGLPEETNPSLWR